MLSEILERITGLRRFDQRYRQAMATRGDRDPFAAVADRLGYRFRVAQEELERVPRTGPAIVIANHPSGMFDGTVLPAMLKRIRPDTRILAHRWFERFPEVAESMFLIDPQAKTPSRADARALRDAYRWVEDGGLLLVYPAGEIARRLDEDGFAVDEPWKPGIARLVRETGAPVIPVRILARNRSIFYLLSALHSRWHMLLLAWEAFAISGSAVEIRIGRALQPSDAPGSESALLEFLRARVQDLDPLGVCP